MRTTSLQEKQFNETFCEIYITPKKIRDGRWQLDYLQRLQVRVIHAEVAGLISIETHEPSVNWTSSTLWVYCKLEPQPLVSSRFVYASLFIFRVGLTVISFHLSVTKRTMWNWSNSSMATFVRNLNRRAFLLALPKCLVILKCDTI